MSNLSSIQEIIKDIFLFTQSMGIDSHIPNISQLRKSYRQALRNYQSYMPVNDSSDLFISKKEVEEALIDAYTKQNENSLDDLNQKDIIHDKRDSDSKLSWKQTICSEALELLSSLDPPLSVAFDLIVHSVIFRDSAQLPNIPSARGGSSSGAIGLLWIGSIPPAITAYDIVEIFVHELTHHALFIDELITPHFIYDRIPDKRFWAYSAILNKHRPLDKVVHSIVVAIEIAKFRSRINAESRFSHYKIHPETSRLLEETETACNSVLSLRHLDSVACPKVISLVQQCKDICKCLKSGKSISLHPAAGFLNVTSELTVSM